MYAWGGRAFVKTMEGSKGYRGGENDSSHIVRKRWSYSPYGGVNIGGGRRQKKREQESRVKRAAETRETGAREG